MGGPARTSWRSVPRVQVQNSGFSQEVLAAFARVLERQTLASWYQQHHFLASIQNAPLPDNFDSSQVCQSCLLLPCAFLQLVFQCVPMPFSLAFAFQPWLPPQESARLSAGVLALVLRSSYMGDDRVPGPYSSPGLRQWQRFWCMDAVQAHPA